MDSERAVEIMKSRGVIGVSFKDKPVWLEGIKDDMASVIELETNRKLDVPLKSLSESRSDEGLR